jgi:Ca-activated chloride channel homolog
VSFSSPLWLLALALVPLLLGVRRLAERRRRRYAVRFPATSSVVAAITPANAVRTRLPGAVLLAALAALTLALAGPRVTQRVAVQQASVMLVSDHSGSMAASDVSPTRLAAAIRSADTFIAGLPNSVKVGAVTFGSSADAVQGPSADHSAAKGTIDGQQANGATDTGDALALALQLLHGGSRNHPPAAIVLLSDGSANTGEDPATVARQAAGDHIPIFTVALGTPDGTLTSPDPLAAPVPVPPDPELMARLAQLSGGRSFNAQSADQLSSIYAGLASELGTVKRERGVTAPVILGAVLLIGLGAVVSVRRTGRLP